MNRTVVVAIAGEGLTDIAVLRRLLGERGLEPASQHDTSGKGGFDRRLAGFAAAARYGPWVILRDLDRDAPCAGALVARLVPRRPDLLRFRVAVHAVEAWLLADDEALAGALGIDRRTLPRDPEALLDPKAALVELARRSPRRSIRRDLVPSASSGRRVGPGYTGFVLEFIAAAWSPARASEAAPSLARARRAIADLSHKLTAH